MPSLYVLIDGDTLGLERVAVVAAEVADAGVEWIQLRLKSGSDDARFRAVCETAERLEGSQTRLWLDDRLDLAACLAARGPRGVEGVHLGRRDLPPSAAAAAWGQGQQRSRTSDRPAPPLPWIGLSCHDVDQVAAADADPAVDVVAIGPVFPTRSKANPDPVVGLAGVRAARAATRKPLVAIGGIDADSLPAVLEAGASSAAVLGAVCAAVDPAAAARELLERCAAVAA